MRELVAATPSVDAPARRWDPIVVGLVAVVVAFLAFGVLHALQQPPFIGPDETAHVGYAQEVASGRLPEIDTWPQVPAEATQWQAERGSARGSAYLGVWVANHPPLFYVAVAPLIWLSRMFGAADGGLLMLRFANVGFAAVGVLFTYLLASEVTRRNRRLALAAAALAALVPHGHAVFSQGMNDGLGFAAGTAVVWAGVRCLRRSGPLTGRDLAALALTTTVAFGARTSTMLLATVVVGLVALQRVLRPAADTEERIRRVAPIVVLGIVPGAVLFGWFYLRNMLLYGDIGASHHLLRLFQREERGSVLSMFNRRFMWIRVYESLMSPTTRARVTPPGSFVLTLIAAVGVCVTLVTGRLGRRATPADDGTARAALRWSIALCLLTLAVVATTIAQHVSGGGNAHARYAMPAIGAAAVLVVVGLERLWSRWGPIALIAIAGWWAVVNIPVDVKPWVTRGGRDDFLLPPAALRTLPLSDGWRDLAGLVLAVAVVAAAVALVASARRGDSPAPADEPVDELAQPSTRSA